MTHERDLFSTSACRADALQGRGLQVPNRKNSKFWKYIPPEMLAKFAEIVPVRMLLTQSDFLSCMISLRLLNR